MIWVTRLKLFLALLGFEAGALVVFLNVDLSHLAVGGIFVHHLFIKVGFIGMLALSCVDAGELEHEEGV